LTAPSVDARFLVIISSLFEVVNTQQQGSDAEVGTGLETKQAAILAPMPTQTSTAVKKVVDKKVA
jgi:hypothetical protein